jgi:hypothetical protein
MRKKPIKTLTIRKLPEEVADAVRKRAEDSGLSFSRALIALVQDHLNDPVKTKLFPEMAQPKKKKKRDLNYMRTWSQKEYDDFMKDLADQRRIDPDMWK